MRVSFLLVSEKRPARNRFVSAVIFVAPSTDCVCALERIIPFYDPTDDRYKCARFAKPGVGNRPRNRSTDSAGAMGERGAIAV